MDFSNKHVVVTGGSSGIGKALVRELIKAGAQVLTCGRDAERLQTLEHELPDIKTVQADIATPAGRNTLLAEANKLWSHIDVLINNAGVQYSMDIGSGLPDAAEKIQQEMDINFTAQVLLIDLMLPMLKNSADARLVNISSCLALTPKRSAPVYCASKAAFSSFSQALSYQLEGSSVKVVVVYPPLVDTPMTAGRGAKTISAGSFAHQVISDIAGDKNQIYVGKAKILKVIHRLLPAIAQKILKNS